MSLQRNTRYIKNKGELLCADKESLVLCPVVLQSINVFKYWKYKFCTMLKQRENNTLCFAIDRINTIVAKCTHTSK